MEMQSEQLENGLTTITLAGKMDIVGTQDIDVRFTGLTASKGGFFIVDLSGVTFLASIGIRTFITSAKALTRRGGKMVLLNPQPMVENVLKVSWIDTILPIFFDLDAARIALKSSGS
jgi:anti-anti-sigma factor